MQFDDRLATVLRSSATSERAARTQFRQLLDLIGSAPAGADLALVEHAVERLDELAEILPEQDLQVLARDPGLRLRNPALVEWLADKGPAIASAAMANAKLSDAHWQQLIPQLSVTARGLLRNRRNLPAGAAELLARLGVRDLVLQDSGAVQDDTRPFAKPQQAAEPAEELLLDAAAIAATPANDPEWEDSEIGALRRRIESFQKTRADAVAADNALRLPLGDQPEEPSRRKMQSFDFATDPEGKLTWTEPGAAAVAIGASLGSERPETPGKPDEAIRKALRRKQPIRGGRMSFEGAPAIAGEWQVDAIPHFDLADGGFTGFRGRFRRPGAEAAPRSSAPAADRMRQMLHELRTPVNAIQGYAEIIQQQVCGPVPNEYRSLAAAIGVDIARIQAGFDELERLARLETNAMVPEDGDADLVAVTSELLDRLKGALRPRGADISLDLALESWPINLDGSELQSMIWRLMGTIGGAIAPGEQLEATLYGHRNVATLSIDLPAALEKREDIFAATEAGTARTVSAGMFGTGFTLRLARAEARAVGGDLEREDSALLLRLPLLTDTSLQNSDGNQPAGKRTEPID